MDWPSCVRCGPRSRRVCAAIATPLLGAATDAMGVAGWLKVTEPEIYAHRLRNKPDEPQGVPFSYLEVDWQGSRNSNGGAFYGLVQVPSPVPTDLPTWWI